MILTRLKGGLGNQMFQYACGRALSIRNNNPLKLDISDFAAARTSDTPRDYSLSHFNIKEDIATPEEITALKYPHGKFSKAMRLARAKILRQFNIGFDPNIFKKVADKKDYYLDGFWQSELFFKDQEKEIRNDFTLKQPMESAAAAIAEQIKIAESVSIHIRRGDVARDAATNPYFGICTPDYYANALNYFASSSKVKNPHVFVFSDDTDWVKQNIPINFPHTFVSSKNPAGRMTDYEELVLMSTCRHNIIANSSFSWWGAWLNANPEKIVIAPKKWITRNKKVHADTVPTTWIRL